MTPQFRVLPEFFGDVRVARDWYNTQQAGRGSRLVDEVDATLDQLAESPWSRAPVDLQTRVAIVHSFPYGVYYRTTDTEVIVPGLFHLHRRPGLWKLRTK